MLYKGLFKDLGITKIKPEIVIKYFGRLEESCDFDSTNLYVKSRESKIYVTVKPEFLFLLDLLKEPFKINQEFKNVSIFKPKATFIVIDINHTDDKFTMTLIDKNNIIL